MISKTSLSPIAVWSNPGVSNSVTDRPSRSNGIPAWTARVHESKELDTRRFDPLTRLINWKTMDPASKKRRHQNKHLRLTVDLPLPVGPMTLMGVGKCLELQACVIMTGTYAMKTWLWSGA